MTEPTGVKADIVPYTEEYADVVRSWIESEETYFNVCRGKDFPPPEDIVGSWQREGTSSYILFANRQPVAYGELWPRPAERAVEITHVLVDPYKRQEGYGTKILQLLYERAAARPHIIKVVVNLYNDSEAALGTYVKAGFELYGTSPHTMGLRMVRMVKR